MDDGQSKYAEFAVDRPSNRTRSGSASSGHKRSLSGSLLSRLSFLRLSQSTQSEVMEQDGDSEHIGTNRLQAPSNAPVSGRAMSAVIQQQRRTRRRRGSLRKTALLGTRLESREKRSASKSTDAVPRFHDDAPRSPKDQTSFPDEFTAPGGFTDEAEDIPTQTQPSWFRASTAQKILRPSLTRRRQGLTQQNLLSEETGTDDEEPVAFPRINTTSGTNSAINASTTALHISTPSSGSDSYYPMTSDATYRSVHHKSSPLASHPVEMKNNVEITWDYSETEWWGWIILMVTWLVFVVGIGSCFEVWSWAWDVGETPYAPPELEDDPTLPIVGYYPALIILTAVMAWVWVVVAWVGMKYFKHANISGDDS
ncbi:hypothetical protein N7523_004901 [Penicillium sp. IBT 18751x]|nr:hypothetical protein N7523_004901 [Penicillium sp. IBT 18751x]